MDLQLDFIFYHIEKCGGTSISYMLEKYYNNIYNNNQIFNSNNIRNHIQFTKKNIEIIKQEKQVDYNNLKAIMSHTRIYDFPHLFENTPLKITIVRNPIDRIISHYYHFDKNNYNCEMIDLPHNIFKKYCIGHGRHMCRVLDCIESNNYFNVKKLKYIIKKFTYILILENIDEDVKKLNNILNIHYNCNHELNIIKINESTINKHNIKDYELLKEKIKIYCGPDIRLYNMIKKYNYQ
jgi:hypothetical protein